MKRTPKALLYGLAAAIAIGLAAGTWLTLAFDPNDYRDDIAARVRAATGRDLVIEGDLALRLLPRPQVRVGRMRLAPPAAFDGAGPFAQVESVTARLRPRSLLHGRVEIESLALHGLDLELHRRADGTTSWDDLLALVRGAAPGDTAVTLPPVRIERFSADGIQLHYRNEQAGRSLELLDGNVTVAPFDGRFPVAIEAELTALNDRIPALSVALRSPALRYARGTLSAEAPRIEIKTPGAGHIQTTGALAAQSLTVSGGDGLCVAAPAVALELAGTGVPGGVLKVNAEAPAMAARLKTAMVAVDDVKAELDGMPLTASVQAFPVAGAPGIAGELHVAPVAPAALVRALGLEGYAGAGAAALRAVVQHVAQAELDTRFALNVNGLELKAIELVADDTRVHGVVRYRSHESPQLRFGLLAETLPLERWLAAGASGPTAPVLAQASAVAPAAPPLARTTAAVAAIPTWLHGLDADGTFQVIQLDAAGVHATDVKFDLYADEAAHGFAEQPRFNDDIGPRLAPVPALVPGCE